MCCSGQRKPLKLPHLAPLSLHTKEGGPRAFAILEEEGIAASAATVHEHNLQMLAATTVNEDGRL